MKREVVLASNHSEIVSVCLAVIVVVVVVVHIIRFSPHFALSVFHFSVFPL